jgi:hypothetical protein
VYRDSCRCLCAFSCIHLRRVTHPENFFWEVWKGEANKEWSKIPSFGNVDTLYHVCRRNGRKLFWSFRYKNDGLTHSLTHSENSIMQKAICLGKVVKLSSENVKICRPVLSFTAISSGQPNTPSSVAVPGNNSKVLSDHLVYPTSPVGRGRNHSIGSWRGSKRRSVSA